MRNSRPETSSRNTYVGFWPNTIWCLQDEIQAAIGQKLNSTVLELSEFVEAELVAAFRHLMSENLIGGTRSWLTEIVTSQSIVVPIAPKFDYSPITHVPITERCLGPYRWQVLLYPGIAFWYEFKFG